MQYDWCPYKKKAVWTQTHRKEPPEDTGRDCSDVMVREMGPLEGVLGFSGETEPIGYLEYIERNLL